MNKKSTTILEKTKKIVSYILFPLIGLVLLAKVFFDLFGKKEILKKALIEDQGKIKEAAAAKTKAETASEEAAELEEKITKIQEDAEWHKKRNNF